ncbi:MAG: dihydroorotase [Clostridia bacterium]|nr:dihydroorotase [Clostridia bacterium]
MRYLLSGAQVYGENGFDRKDVLVDNGRIVSITAPVSSIPADTAPIDLRDLFLFPGFVDVHVHLREPGFSYKETIATGTAAAARGGFTSVCSMPNLNPPPDSAEHLTEQTAIIRRDAAVHVHPYGTLTVCRAGQAVAPLAEMTEAVAFSDDGSGVQDDAVMREAMRTAAGLNKIVAAHCEVNDLLRGGYIHDGEYAAAHGHRGICSESEWGQIKRDLELVRETGVKYHVCHISCAESVDLIRAAKAEGLDVTCETGPHYLTLTDADLEEDGRFKMNPPLRSARDRAALIEGIIDGTVDMIATDHAPHSAEEKTRGLEKSAMGVVGLETAFAVCYTHLVKTGIIPLERLIDLMSIAPARRFGIGASLSVGQPADLCAFALNESFTVDPSKFASMGKATPFAGQTLFGVCKYTIVNGGIVWQQS